jgi:hypothetical protein
MVRGVVCWSSSPDRRMLSLPHLDDAPNRVQRPPELFHPLRV